jgi:hypothetical protein
MNVPTIFERHRALRWLAPVGIIGVAALAATGMFKASASSESLPQTTPAALIAAVQHNQVGGFSGTVVSHFSLGLPELPTLPNMSDDTSFNALLSGSHTLQVWYGGFDKQRVALLAETEETDLFRNGTDLWQWSSADHLATHSTLPARDHGASDADPSSSIAASVTPVELARRALGALNPSTKVTVDSDHTVADRSAYELVLTPRSSATKVGSVHIAVDGATKVPLGVQVYPRDSATPAIDVAFTSIRFAHQPDRNFEFVPPPGAQVRELHASNGTSTAVESKSSQHRATRPTKTGSGWTTVLSMKPGKAAIAKFGKGALLKGLTPVSGSWGKGRLLDSALLSVLVTDDGRVYAGAVDPANLYAAAGSK